MNHRFVAFVAVLLYIAVVPAAPRSTGATTLATPVVEIPIDLSTRHVSVEVSINGEGPFHFNLDTYAVTTACVDQRFAKRMGFKKVDTVMNSDGSGVVVERDLVLIPELKFGGATFRNVRALVDDYSWVKTPEGGAIDGLLGYHLFRELLLEIDYPRKVVILQKGELSANDEHVVSHRALRDRPDFPLHIGKQRIIVGVDSGAASDLSLPSSFIERLKLAEPPVTVGRAKTVYSEADIQTGVLSEPLRFADHEQVGVTATFSELFGKPLLGHGLLAQYSVTFDQKNGRIRFVRPRL